MLSSTDLVVSFLTLWIFLNNVKCQDLTKLSKTLDEILADSRSLRRPRNYEDAFTIWQEYEFGTEAGNREEIVVTDISPRTFVDTTENTNILMNNWQFFQTDTSYFISAENSTLSFHKINLDDLSIVRAMNISIEGQILQYKVLRFNIEQAEFNVNYANSLMVILLVKSQHGYVLYWYKIVGDTYMLYSKFPLRKHVQDMEFMMEENQHELLVLDNNDAHLGGQSLIDIYGFDIDHTKHHVDMWFCRRLFVPNVFDVQVCPIYGRTVLAFQGIDNVLLYESKYEDKMCHFEKLEAIKFNKLTNLVCFESGSIEYLATGGETLHLFHFVEKDFHVNVEIDLHFNETTEVMGIVAIPLNTYRDESLLLIQLKNSTVIALAWHGSEFKAVPLPNQVLNNFDLSRVVVIPKIGFVHKNTLVRIEVTLSSLENSIHDETESVLKTQALLNEVFRKQEAVFDETEAQFNQSYFKNPVVSGLWNFSKLNVLNATIEKNVDYGSIKVKSIDLEDMLINVTTHLKKLEELDAKLEQNLNSENVINSTKISLPSNIELTGDFLVNGTLYAKNVFANFINNVSTSITHNGTANLDLISGQNSFLSIDINNLTVFSLNGIPYEQILFDFPMKNYSKVNFSKLKRLEVNGHLNFSKVNNIDWKNVMQGIVWKNESTIISGKTIVEKLAAKEVHVTNLNGLLYPENYVLTNNTSYINITGEKYFNNLYTAHLNIKMLNGANFTDFINLDKQEIVDEEIIFENLEVDGVIQIDGNITGMDDSSIEPLLNETRSLSSNFILDNLIVTGKIVLEDSINDKTWTDLEDFILKTENNPVVTGYKKFTNNVNVNSYKIESERINNHLLSEFLTLNTSQQFPYLTNISANATFGNTTLSVIKQLENYITHEQDVAFGCLNKMLLFIKPTIVDNLSFDTIKQTISTTFFDKLNRILQQVHFENLTISTLLTNEVLPKTINGVNYTDMAKRALTTNTQQTLTGDLIVDNLETDTLDAKMINELSINRWHLSLIYAKLLYDNIFNENAVIKSLKVTGIITASSINNNNVIDIYKKDNMATVIFNKDVTIENLTVNQLLNNLNFSQSVADAVQKADKNVTFVGHKTLRNITCDVLKMQLINGHFVSNILDPSEKQTLKGPVVINGSVTVSINFNTTGKIGNSMFLSDLTNQFKTFENNSYALHGNYCFTEAASITELHVHGSLQDSTLDSFLEKIVLKNDVNVTISGLKLFKNSVTFNGTFNIDDSLNDLDLHGFYQNVVYIDKPFSINTKITFLKDVYLQKDLKVKRNLQSRTIMGVDIQDLQKNAIALNKPKYFPARMTFDNATFQTSIEVMQVNDLQMDLLISLNTPQVIKTENLNCTNILVRNIQLLGHVNTYNIEDIYADTFMVYGNQNIKGFIKMQGNVYLNNDFNVKRINNFNPAKIVSLTANNTLTGNFTFQEPVVLNKTLRILNSLNKISPVSWQGAAVKTTDKAKEIISGKWRVYGNVHFERNVDGNEFLNEVNIPDVSLALIRERPEVDQIIEETYKDLNNVCELHIDNLKYSAVSQIYKFNTFNYLNIQEFEGDIHSVRHIEVNDVDYILVNYNVCHVKLLSYVATNFQVIDQVSDFGLIDQWIFFKSNNTLYMLTTVKRACGRSFNNVWKLESNRLMHVLELNNVTDVNFHQDEFEAMIQENFEAASENLQPDTSQAVTLHKNKKSNFVSNNDLPVLIDQSLTRKMQRRSLNGTHLKTCLDCITFNVGVYEREMYVHYDEEMSEDYIYMCESDNSQTKILQTIKARQPKSFLILQFGGFVETLLVFVENNDIIQIYEYAGIAGFVHRNTIQIKVDMLYNFKLRKYGNLQKRHCLAVVHKNRLTILEAKMYGEKLDLRSTDSCYMNDS
ncbi:hypothetical protein PUN28_006268 [Cardiocondyla obscurior]|uniref:Uncharacterized protein n=2 Tax=Cardiocondyla obscurior TaxID=286306 RepID=A0AAW2G7V0_9HYME